MLGLAVWSLLYGSQQTKQIAVSAGLRLQNERVRALRELEQLYSVSLQGFASDYSYWDELVAFVAKPDEEWAEVNLAGTLKNFDLSSLYVLRPDGKVVWVSGGSLNSGAPIDASAIEGLLERRKPVTSFFQRDMGDVVEICVSPIVPSRDREHAGPIYGWLVVARRWDPKMTSSLEKASDTSITYSGGGVTLPLSTITEDGTFAFNQRLFGLRGEIVGYRSFHRNDDLARLMRISQEESLSRTIIIIICLAVLMVVLTYPLVAKPLIAIRRSLERQAVEPLKDYRRSRSEVGLLARLIESALNQRQELVLVNSELEDRVKLRTSELEEAYEATIAGLAMALEYRDEETEGHCQRVTAMVLRLATELGLPSEQMVHIQRGALLHDIGKIAVPDRILLKNGPLTPEEWKVMRRHPTTALHMLQPIKFLEPALSIPYYHHERWDGTGYPLGLHGEQIPIEARLFALVDIWDALRSDRPYRSAWPVAKVIEHIKSLSGTHLDPKVVDLFLSTYVEEELDRKAA